MTFGSRTPVEHSQYFWHICPVSHQKPLSIFNLHESTLTVMNFLKYSIRQPKNTNAKEDKHQLRGVDKLRKQAAAASMAGSTALCGYAAVVMSALVVDAGATPTARLESQRSTPRRRQGVFGIDAGRRRSLGLFSRGPTSKVPNAQPSQPTASASTSRSSPARQTHATTPACEARSGPSRLTSIPENGPRHAQSDCAGSLLLRLTCLAADSNVRSRHWRLQSSNEPEAGFRDAIEKLCCFH